MYTHSSSSMKARRQSVILELIDREPLHSQELLRRRLHQRGFEATQATISRDIAELGLVKRSGDGAYQRPGAEATNPETALAALERAANEFLRRIDRVQQLVVVRTRRAQAQRAGAPLPTNACAPWIGCSGSSSSGPAGPRPRRSPRRSTAPACRKWSARLPATTRFSWSRAGPARPPPRPHARRTTR